MSNAKERIVIPSEEEVDRYGKGPGEHPDRPEEGAAAGQTETTAAPEPPQAAEENWKELALRARAELSNYQKRVERDRAETLRYANTSLAKALLPVLDDLERVIQSGSDANCSVPALVEGIKLTLDQLLKTLREFHVEPITAEGQPFDPQFHEAMMEQPSDHPERVVLQELAKGYMLHDRVLRPSKVIVSKPKE